MAEQEGKRLWTLLRSRQFFANFNSIKFYGKEKHNAKILSIYFSKFDKRSQNYLSIKVHVKWSLGEFKRFIAWNTALC